MIPLAVVGAAAFGLGLWSHRSLTERDRALLKKQQARLNAPRFSGASPADINAKMRVLGVAARNLDVAILSNVSRPEFRAGWGAWFSGFNGFVDRNYDRAGTFLHPDELDAQVEGYRAELLGWWSDYAQQKLPNGAPVPAPAGNPPVTLPVAPNGGSSGGQAAPGIPWWVWVGGGAAISVGVYLWWQSRKQTQHGYALAPQRDPGYGYAPPTASRVSRDCGGGGGPPAALTLDRYVADPMGLYYRPYEHPHLVPVATPASSVPSGYVDVSSAPASAAYEFDEFDE